MIDAGIALLVGVIAASAVLWLLSVIEPTLFWRDAFSIVALQALPATIGASLARGQLGEAQPADRRRSSYGHELFLMTAGAVVFAANVAPTEEVVLIAAMMSEVDALPVVVQSIVLGLPASIGAAAARLIL